LGDWDPEWFKAITLQSKGFIMVFFLIPEYRHRVWRRFMDDMANCANPFEA